MNLIRSTANLAMRLSSLASLGEEGENNKNLFSEAAHRLVLLQDTLGEMIDDRQLVDHSCKDAYCPVLKARQIYCLGKK